VRESKLLSEAATLQTARWLLALAPSVNELPNGIY